MFIGQTFSLSSKEDRKTLTKIIKLLIDRGLVIHSASISSSKAIISFEDENTGIHATLTITPSTISADIELKIYSSNIEALTSLLKEIHTITS